MYMTTLLRHKIVRNILMSKNFIRNKLAPAQVLLEWCPDGKGCIWRRRIPPVLFANTWQLTACPFALSYYDMWSNEMKSSSLSRTLLNEKESSWWALVPVQTMWTFRNSHSFSGRSWPDYWCVWGCANHEHTLSSSSGARTCCLGSLVMQFHISHSCFWP